MLTLKRFSKSDWNGWAGAEPFEHNHLPLIGEIKIKGDKDVIVAIVDKMGMGLYYCSLSTSCEDDCYFHYPEAMDLLIDLKDEMTVKEITEVFIAFNRQTWPIFWEAQEREMQEQQEMADQKFKEEFQGLEDVDYNPNNPKI